jgi:hypothetical protein
MGREAVAVVESRSDLRYGDAVWLAWVDGVEELGSDGSRHRSDRRVEPPSISEKT